jgi:hypothetical protein
MTSAWLTQRNVHPVLLCSEPVGASLPTRQLTRNNDRLGPMHLSRYGPVDSVLWFTQSKDMAFADGSGAQRHLNSP